MTRLLATLAVLGLLIAAACNGDTAPEMLTDVIERSEPTTTVEGTGEPPPDGAESAGPDGDLPAAPGPPTTAPPTTDAPATPAPPAPSGPAVGLRLTRVAQFNQPVAMAQAAGDPAIYVAEKGGRIRALRLGVVAETVLDITGDVSGGSEQGLLGIAFAPGRNALYVNYTDRSGTTRVVEYAFSAGRAGARREVLNISQPYANHNGGHLAFGPDGMLYIGTGDGGAAGDPQGRAQNPNQLLGKMLRIDAGRQGAQPEIWQLGLRNPWRYSFDRATGDLWIGDVGQNEWEEVNVAPAGTRGQNWGWNLREGTHPFRGGSRPPGNVDPIHEYANNSDCSITGGYVYRGTRLQGWQGRYFFGDYCGGWVRALTRDGTRATVHDTGLSTQALASFGEDRDGELYVMSLRGDVYRIDPR